MSKTTALRCDWEFCNAVETEISARSCGWLSVGGERRGRARTDLCPYHARSVIAQLTKSLAKAKKR